MRKQLLIACLLLLSICSYAQQITIKGIVTSATDKEPLIGATVQVKGTGSGTITGINGDYILSNVEKNAVLVFSSIGFESQEIAVGSQTTINVVLKEATELLDEVVVIGYGAVKKSDLTSSIATVKGEEITETVTGNAMDALQGKVNGVQVTSGGGPGATPKVLIRGVTTANGTNTLYVVDGMPVGDNINFLNSNDIASMEVLKDASAAAIYGTRASNGVILITTKKGKTGKARINWTTSVGFQTIAKPDIAGPAEYKEVFNTRYTNDNAGSIWKDNGATTNPGGTDWWDTVVNKTALVQNHSLSVAGGSEQFVYNFSVGYYRNNSQFDVGYWDKINIRLNTEYTFNKYVKLGVDIAPRVESWDDTPNVFSAAMAMDPTTPVFRPQDQWEDNEFNNYQRSYNYQEWNPAGTVARQNAHSREMGAILNTYLQVNPIEKLTLRTQFGANAHYRRSDTFIPEFSMDPLEQQPLSEITRRNQEWFDWNWTNTATYADTYAGKHNLNVMGGFTAERYAWYSTQARRDNVPNNLDQMQEVNAGQQGTDEANGETTYNTLVSFLGRVMYNYENRFFISASLRADGSSNLHPDHRWGVFPSFSAAWRISSEKFMENLTWIDDLKLRGGWGQTGNQSGIGDYAYLQRYNIGRIEWFKKGGEGDSTDYANAVPTISQANLRTSDLTWETTTQTNIGLDLTILNGRLTFNADYYYKKTKNMLMNVSLPAGAAAATSIARNEGEMVNKGFELSISSKNLRGGAFTWDTDFNISFNRNKLTKLELQKVYYDAKTADVVNDYVVRNEPGRALGGFYGYISDGVDPETGELMYRDLNNDGKISSSDRTYIGDPNPDFTYGMTNTFSWKGFNLSIFIQGSYGNDIYNASRIETEGMYDGKNQSTRVLNRWKIPGQITDMPKANFKLLNSTYFVEDGSYLRLKDVSLSYNVKGKLLKKWGITRLQPYFTATNLLTWTSYSGMDPEVNQWGNSGTVQGIDWGTYPHCRSYVFGINVEF